MSVIESKRIYLRTLSESDATDRYVDWLNDAEVNQYLEVRHSKQSIDTCKQFISDCNSDESSHLFGIFLRENDLHIGNAKLGFINRHHLTGEISLFIGDKSYWGKGYASEVVTSLTDFGFKELGLERIEAGCYESNLGSLKVFLNAGYTVEGFLRKHVISNGRREGCFWMGILRSEYIK